MGNCKSEIMVEFDYVYTTKKVGRPNFFSHDKINLVLWIYRRDAYRALKLAEHLKGGPVNYPEVVRAYREVTRKPLVGAPAIKIAIEDFYRDDRVLFDREGDRFSLNPAM